MEILNSGEVAEAVVELPLNQLAVEQQVEMEVRVEEEVVVVEQLLLLEPALRVEVGWVVVVRLGCIPGR
jgi:hypothetical protein